MLHPLRFRLFGYFPPLLRRLLWVAVAAICAWVLALTKGDYEHIPDFHAELMK